MFLFGFSHASATSVDMNVMANADFIESYAGELNFINCQNKESVSQSCPSKDHKKESEHHLLFIEIENKDDDEDSSDHNEFLKCKDHFITLFNFNTIVEEVELESSNYTHAEVNTLPTDHFLFLEFQVFRI